MASTDTGSLAKKVVSSGSQRRRPPRVIVVTVILVALLGTSAVVLFTTFPPPAPGPACGGPAPCYVAFSWGMPFNNSGSVSKACQSSLAHYCYSIEIAGAESTENLTLSLRSADDVAMEWPSPSVDVVSLVSPAGAVIADYGTMNSTWRVLVNTTVHTGGDTLVIYTPHVGTAYGLEGDSILARVAGPDAIWASFPSTEFP